MLPVIIGILIAAPIIYGIDWYCMDRPFIPKFLKGRSFKSLQPTVRRIQKMERDAQAALDAIKNLHETKKRINAEFREMWDSEFRLLLPPPVTPKREPLKFVNLSGTFHAYDAPEFPDNDYLEGVRVSGQERLTPVGWTWGQQKNIWFVFNNIPGQPHRILFLRQQSFKDMPDRWWLALPYVDEAGGQYTWSDNKLKALAGNLKEEVKFLITS